MIIFVKLLKLKQNIPNFLTCCNLLCGCLAIQQIFDGDIVLAACLVGIALIFDFFDGFVARMLKVTSPIGKDLDSLADMVTFGVVPGIIMYELIRISSYRVDGPAASGWTIYPQPTELPNLYITFLAFIIPVFSAIRLAKFNNDTRQSESFIGLPTPANAIFITSLLFLPNEYSRMLTTNTLCVLTIILSLLLVAPIPLFALKFKSFGWKGNEIRFVFLILSLGLLIGLKYLGIPLIIILYIVLSVINNLLSRKKAVS